MYGAWEKQGQHGLWLSKDYNETEFYRHFAIMNESGIVQAVEHDYDNNRFFIASKSKHSDNFTIHIGQAADDSVNIPVTKGWIIILPCD